MSSITFASEQREASISGLERKRYAQICLGMFEAVMGRPLDLPSRPSPLRQFIKPGHYSLTSERFERDFFTAINYGDAFVGPTEDDAFTVALNTALAVGGDALRLMARLHGQCEIHAYVEGQDRAWLAEIVERGVAGSMLSRKFAINGHHDGYEGVIALLRETADGPVVCSYSVCDSFPPADAFEDGETRSFAAALPWLRAHPGKLRLDPADWDSYRFGAGTTAFDLRRLAYEALP